MKPAKRLLNLLFTLIALVSFAQNLEANQDLDELRQLDQRDELMDLAEFPDSKIEHILTAAAELYGRFVSFPDDFPDELVDYRKENIGWREIFYDLLTPQGLTFEEFDCCICISRTSSIRSCFRPNPNDLLGIWNDTDEADTFEFLPGNLVRIGSTENDRSRIFSYELDSSLCPWGFTIVTSGPDDPEVKIVRGIIQLESPERLHLGLDFGGTAAQKTRIFFNYESRYLQREGQNK